MFDREGDEKYRFIETVTFLQDVALDSIILRAKITVFRALSR